MTTSSSPLVFWCYVLERRMKIINACPRDNFLLQGECQYTRMTGQSYDIFNFCEFEWFERVTYRLYGKKFPYQSEKLGRCLGPSNDAGSGMAQYVLTDKGTLITIQTRRLPTPAEMNSPTETKKREIFKNLITMKFGNSSLPPPNWNEKNKPRSDNDIDDDAVIVKADKELVVHNISVLDISEYYKYMLLYVDNALCCSEHPMEAMLELNKHFPVKKDKKGKTIIGPTSIYLGGKILAVELPNGVNTWAISSSQYIQECVRNVEEKLKAEGKALRKGTSSPLRPGHHPECDVSPELNEEEASYYQSLVGVTRWIVEMGQIDIACEVSMLSTFVAMPREGHLQQMII